jgi:hypothetical protein
MALVQDGIGAMVALLTADATITALLSSRVYGLELPKADASSMPRKAIVINSAGGQGESSYRDVFKYRLDFICYGETPFEAYEVFRTLRAVLREIERQVVSSTFVYSAEHSAGPFSFRDTESKWPHTIDTWLVKIQDTSA